MLRRSYLAALVAVLLLVAVTACGTTAPAAVQTVAPDVQTVVVPVQQTVIVQQTTAPQVQVVTATPAPTKPAPTGTGSKSISVAATWGGAERDAFLAVADAFTAKTGIQVNYESMRQNEGAILRTRVAAGNPPDIALEPRPGEVAEFARAGNLADLTQCVSKDDLLKAFNQGYLDIGNVDGKQVGFVWKANSKSTFWTRAADFKANGWTPPKNMDEFVALL